MKIALTVHDLHEYGGHSLYTKILADGLSQRHQVTVFANRCERHADAQWSFRRVPACRLNALATVQTFPLGLRIRASQLRTFDIHHSQGYCGGQPNVVTAHRCMAAYLASLKSISLRHRISLETMLAAESRFYKDYQGTIIAVSRQIADELQAFYRPRGPIEIIPHGVDLQRFKSANRLLYRQQMREQWGIDNEATVALYVGDLTKAHSHLEELSQAAPEVQFVMVTRSTSYHWTAPNVRIAPLTREIERYYAAADAFLFPSANDPFGLVVLEAMASGLPVFTSDRAGAAELITSGRDSFVIGLDDWVTATSAGLRHPNLLRSTGIEAENTARRHDWSSVTTRVEEVYYKVASELVRDKGGIVSNEYRYQQ